MKNQITNQDKLNFSTFVFKTCFLKLGFLAVALLLGFSPVFSQIAILITPNAGQAKILGQVDPTPFTYTYAPALQGTDEITGLMGRDEGESAGTYAFTLGTLDAGSNYTLSVASSPTFRIFANATVAENALPGNPSSEWDLTYPNAGDLSIQGFATDISVNTGGTINFKIDVDPPANYTIKIYRLGYYQGNGARLIADLGTFAGVAQPDSSL